MCALSLRVSNVRALLSNVRALLSNVSAILSNACALKVHFDTHRILVDASIQVKCLTCPPGPRSRSGLFTVATMQKCIALASNGTFIAASASSSLVSFWDATTHKQVGPVMTHRAHS